MSYYTPPRFDMYEVESGAEASGQRWFQGFYGTIDEPATAVTLGYQSPSIGRVLTTTSFFSAEDSPEDRRVTTLLVMTEGFRQNTSGAVMPDAAGTHQLLREFVHDDHWHQTHLQVNGQSMPAELLRYQTLWTVTGVAGELAFSVAAAGKEAPVLNLAPVNDWSTYGIDLSRSWSGDELNMYYGTRVHPENHPGP